MLRLENGGEVDRLLHLEHKLGGLVFDVDFIDLVIGRGINEAVAILIFREFILIYE